jgi:hypothetical protein
LKPLFALSVALVSTVSLSAPAWASLASETFTDVPDGHWAQDGIAELAIKRDMMRGYPDGTFRGELPFTRFQFALAMKELIDELERISKTSLRSDDPCLNTYADINTAVERDVILDMANAYCLFEGVPGIQSNVFSPDQQVTRSEVSKVIANLMELADRQDIVRPRNGKKYQFSDVSNRNWAFDAIQMVSDRYGVMIGFPDNTFRPDDQLTRYQFAQAGYQTVPLIRELIAKTLEQKTAERALELSRLWQQRNPWHLDARLGAMGAGLRWIGYPNSFVMADLRGIFSQASPLFDAQLGWWPTTYMLGQVHLQPYLAPRLAYESAAGPYLGLGLGLGAYWRANLEWGFAGNLRSGYVLKPQSGGLGQGGAGFLLDTADLEVEYYVNPNLAIVPGVSLYQDPRGAGAVDVALKLGVHLPF